MELLSTSIRTELNINYTLGKYEFDIEFVSFYVFIFLFVIPFLEQNQKKGSLSASIRTELNINSTLGKYEFVSFCV